MRFELGHVALCGRLWNSAFNDAIEAAGDVTAKCHPLLARSHVHSNVAQITDDDRLLILATPKQAQDASLKRLDHGPAERQPQPAIAGVAQQAATQVWARLFALRFVILVNQVRYGIYRLGQYHARLSLLRVAAIEASPRLTPNGRGDKLTYLAQGGLAVALAGAADAPGAFGIAAVEPPMALQPATSLRSAK